MLLLEKIENEVFTKRKLIFVGVVGLAVRFAVAPFTGHPFDIYVWYQASQSIMKGDLIPSGGFTLMPAWYYTLVPVSYAYHWLSPILSPQPTPFTSLPPPLQSAASWTIPQGSSVPLVTDWLYNLLVKTPSILADLVAGLIMYNIVLPRNGERAAFFSFVIWFLNPMLIWVSSIWGMYDSLPALFSLLAIYFLFEQRYTLCSITEILAISYKVYAIFLVPVLLIYAFRCGLPAKKAMFSIAISIAFALIFFLPYILSGVQDYSLVAQTQHGGTVQAFGLTYWSIEPFVHLTANLVDSLNAIVLAALVCLFLTFSFVLARKGNTDAIFGLDLALISLIFFCYPTVNEQWFIWLLPALVILSVTKRIRFSFLFGLSLVSLLYSWINSQLVAFLLPSYVYGTGSFLEYWAIILGYTSVYRLALMAFLGVTFSAILGTCIFSIFKNTFSSLQNYFFISSVGVKNLLRRK